jgi:CBS domain containing-hemolysin-like protein
LVLLNGFFVASEFALVKVRRTRLRELEEAGSWRARVARGLTARLDSYLSATQLGVTLASIGLGWIGEPAVAHLIEPALAAAGIASPTVLHGTALTIAFMAVSFLHIILGELAPKWLAIREPEATSLWTAVPLRAFRYLLYPAIVVLNGTATALLRAVGITPALQGDEAHSGEELRMILAASHAHGLVNATARRIVDNALGFSERRAAEIMVPRTEMVTLSVQATLRDNIATALAQRHTRYPLVGRSTDDIVGMVHVQDLLRLVAAGDPSASLASVKRPIVFVPETASIDRVLRTLQRQRTLLAVVVDEYGAPVGVLTMEDVIEQLVGDIEDEFDPARQPVKAMVRDEIDGQAPVSTLERRFGIEVPRDGRTHTVAGVVLAMLGRLPKVGDRLAIGDRTLEVTAVEGRRIARVRVLPRQAGAAGGMARERSDPPMPERH